MSEMKFRGRTITPIFTLGADVKTKEFVLFSHEEVSPRVICQFFMICASLNNMTPEEFAPLLIRGANHLLEEDPDLAEKIRSGLHRAAD